jgi:hypothetical protein
VVRAGAGWQGHPLTLSARLSEHRQPARQARQDSANNKNWEVGTTRNSSHNSCTPAFDFVTALQQQQQQQQTDR